MKKFCMAASLSGAAAVGLLFGPVVQGADYVGASQCKLCHNKPAEGAQWTKWTQMKHHQSFQALSSDRALEVAKKLGLEKAPNESAECLRCHVTAYDVAALRPPKKILAKDGVQCESCHGPASDHLVIGKELKMKKPPSGDIHATVVTPGVETCVKCHNTDNPTWDAEKYTLANGDKSGFDFEQAYAKIAHPNPMKK